jgi:[protein-PII] uridylyltransferase
VSGEPVARPAAVARLLEERSALDRAYSPGHHGRWSAARRADLMDACLRELFEPWASTAGVALVALGGYGRSELAPRSDIDLLLLHDGSATEDVAVLAERLLYPLWDAGLSVGHGVRTPEECSAAALGRLDAITAMFDGRWLGGDRDLWADTRGALLGTLRDEPQAFAEDLRADAGARAERFGHVSHLLEPNLKEGAGGLRDVHALGWLEIALGEDPQLPALDGLGLLRTAEREAVSDAYEFLLRARSALHLETGRPAERLLLEQQPGIAAWMGFSDEPDLRAVDGLMRQVFEHARQVEHVHTAVFDRYLRGGSEARAVEATPEGVLRALGEVAREHGVVPPETLDRIELAGVPDPVEWTDGVRDAFLELVRAGQEGARMFEVLDRVDLLRRYVPEWGLVRCRPQRDPYHRFPVDVHLLHTFANVARLLEEPGEDRVAAEAVTVVRDPDGVFLGALLHDIGKTGQGGHVAAGREVAARVLERMRLPDATRDLAHFMVAEHLLLPDTATRRDLEDDDLVLDVATRVGEPERLAALYLLAVGDALATGPAAWTPWRQTLIRELVAKVERVLERGEAGPETADRLAERAGAVRAILPDVPESELGRFLARMPRPYLLTVAPERIAEHHAIVAPPLGALEVRAHVSPGARPGTHALTVVAADRPGLLALVAGALSLAGLSILTAQVFTTEDGAAVDVFEVEGAFEAEIGEERWREFRTTLRKAIEGRVALEHRVEEKRRRYPPSRHEVPLRIDVHTDASDFFTVVEVGAADRIGLLFDVTRTFAELGLDVHLAKVATYGARVVDAFYVRDVLGRKLDPEQVGELELALRARLGG